MRTLNICMLTNDFPPVCGGGGYHTLYLSLKLIKLGHKVTVITRGTPGNTTYELYQGVPVYRARYLKLYPFQSQIFGLFAHRIFKKIEPDFDILVLNGPIIPYFGTSIPTIIIEHVTARKFIDNLAPGSMFSIIFKLFSKFYINTDVNALKKAGKIVTVSKACAEDIRTLYKLNDITTIPNGVDTSLFTPNIGATDTQDKIILFVGIFGPIKGLFDLVQSAKYVTRSHPGTRFVLAGKGPLEKDLKALVHDLGLQNYFEFVGYLQRDELIAKYQIATICVLPSWYEGMPTTLLEGMSCGIPIVATRVGGSSEVVIDGKTGLLVPKKNPELLAGAIVKLLDAPNLRNAMSVNARNIAIESFDWNKIAQKFENVMYSMLNNS